MASLSDPFRAGSPGGLSRRHLGRLLGALAAGTTCPLFSEHAMAAEAAKLVLPAPGAALDPETVFLNRNENPLGPAPEGIEAIVKTARYGGRYHPFDEPVELTAAIAELRGVKPTYVQPFAGSSDALIRSTLAFTSPTRSWVMADPGYGNGAPEVSGAKTIRVPLRADHSHNAKAMIAADPNAGAYYVCNPNNPSGTVTPPQEIDYLLANKREDAVVIVDEAYIEFSDTAQSAAGLVAADKDVLVLRTFSKVYGMAGIRAGYALGRPDLLDKLRPFGINFGLLPITAVACATASLRAKDLVLERKAINRRIRDDVFAFFRNKGVDYIPSETSFFMVDVKRPWEEFTRAMAARKVIVGRLWPTWPTRVRVSVGSQEEMAKFKGAFEKVLG
jgi:histidinol-phosphate/aromatic aminotransferase/cobyric acid decarboxylase-like protein